MALAMEAPSEKPEESAKVAVKKRGGLMTLPFIIANESFEKVAGYGLVANMILYLMFEYHFSLVHGANVLFLWIAMSNFTPMLGAFISDSYLGRFRVIALGSLISFFGVLMLWCTAYFPSARPPHCNPTKEHCTPMQSKPAQRLLLYCSFMVMSIGAGGIRPCSIAFGADQIDNPDNPKNQVILQTFFNWYYASVGISFMFAVTVIVYIQDKLGWVIGFGIPLGLMFLAVVMFQLGSPFYIKMNSNKSLFTGFAQVAVAAFKNQRLALPEKNSDGPYYHDKGAELTTPSEKLRFINKACLIRSPEEELDSNGLAIDPWRLCTVKKVEGLKALIKVLPIWTTAIMPAVNVHQTFPVVQVNTMDRRFIGNFKIPAASFSVFSIMTLTIWVAIYDRLLVKHISRLTGRARGLSLKHRMGIGLVLSTGAMVVFALVERKRRTIAIHDGLENNPRGVTTMSAKWAVPQFCLLGLAEAFNAIGQVEFYYSQFPKDMTSIAVALVMMGLGTGALVGSLIVTVVSHATGKGSNPSWVDTNINKGHFDYYYWVLAGMSLVNFFYYLIISWAYGSEEESMVSVKEESEVSGKEESKVLGQEDTKEEEMESDRRPEGSQSACNF